MTRYSSPESVTIVELVTGGVISPVCVVVPVNVLPELVSLVCVRVPDDEDPVSVSTIIVPVFVVPLSAKIFPVFVAQVFVITGVSTVLVFVLVVTVGIVVEIVVASVIFAFPCFDNIFHPMVPPKKRTPMNEAAIRVFVSREIPHFRTSGSLSDFLTLSTYSGERVSFDSNVSCCPERTS